MNAATTRQTAAQRREDVLAAAVEEFGAHGYHGASTDAIARRAGISQPYLFRLFGSKRELFVACARRCYRRTLESFQGAAEGLRGMEAMMAMRDAYHALLESDPALLHAQLHGYAAATGDPVIAEAMREGYGDLYSYVARVSGASNVEVTSFFARGMLWNVASAMQLQDVTDEWALDLVAGNRDEER
jgi:AcrR family transcriptional regulator